jgi:hypothetical protein
MLMTSSQPGHLISPPFLLYAGGERSYTTVAFLLATGQAIEAPFRCLDEFDVGDHAVQCATVAADTVAGEEAVHLDERHQTCISIPPASRACCCC